MVTTLLLFEVGPVPCCIDSSSVLTVIEPPPHITAIPGSSQSRPGLFNHLKKPVALYDMRAKFNLEVNQRGKIIVSTWQDKQVGFWVDSISDVNTSDKGKWQPMPSECPRELFHAVWLFKRQLIFKTDIDAMISASVSTHIENFISQLRAQASGSRLTNADHKATAAVDIKTETRPLTENRSVIPEVTPTEAGSSKPAPYTQQIVADISSHSTYTPATLNDHKPPAGKSAHEDIHPVESSLKPSPLATAETVKTDIVSANKSPQKRQVTPTNSPAAPVQSHQDAPRASLTSFESSYQHPISASNERQNDGLLSAFITLAVLLLAIALPLYYLFPWPTSNIEQSDTIEAKNTPVINEQFPDAVEWLASKNEAENNPVLDISTIETTDTEKLSNAGLNDKTETEDTLSPDAEIKTNGNDILITITDDSAAFNLPENVENTETELSVQVTADKKDEPLHEETAVAEQKTENISDTVTEPPPSQTQTKEIEMPSGSMSDEKIIHIVVKGDTLWHIAKRYIKNPLRYKEIARLSKIKNPDLIYPGNRVIIIIRKQNGKKP